MYRGVYRWDTCTGGVQVEHVYRGCTGGTRVQGGVQVSENYEIYFFLDFGKSEPAKKGNFRNKVGFHNFEITAGTSGAQRENLSEFSTHSMKNK